MRRQVAAALIGGVLGGWFYQATVRTARADGESIGSSAARMARALERIAWALERREPTNAK